MRITDFTAKGFFWLPQTPEKRISGVLSVTNGGRVTLEIIGAFEDGHPFKPFPQKYPRILGCVQTYGYVTLENCLFQGGNVDLSYNISAESYEPQMALLGCGFEAGEKIIIDRLDFHVEGLDEWHLITGLSKEFDSEMSCATISYKRPENIVLWAGSGFTVALHFAWTLPGAPAIRSAAINQKSYLSIRTSRLRPLDEFLEVVSHIRNFLCFALDENVSITDIEATSSEIKIVYPGGTERSQAIKIFFESVRFQETAPKIGVHNTLFPFALIAAESQRVLQTWMEVQVRSNPAMALYLSARAGEFKYLNFRFLALAQALETYHKQTTGSVDESQRSRLTAMFEGFREYFGDDAARSSLVSCFVSTRNYYTHYVRRAGEFVAEGADLYALYCKAEVLFQLVLLRALGFSNPVIEKTTKSNESVQRKLSLRINYT